MEKSQLNIITKLKCWTRSVQHLEQNCSKIFDKYLTRDIALSVYTTNTKKLNNSLISGTFQHLFFDLKNYLRDGPVVIISFFIQTLHSNMKQETFF